MEESNDIKTVCNLNYELAWTPKSRQPILKGLIADDFKEAILSKALELKVEIKSIKVMPDQVYMSVSSRAKLSPHQIIKSFKLASSLNLRSKYPQLQKLRHLWSNSYYCCTVGQTSESVLQLYIESQGK